MSDTYQAVYDAARSKIQGGSVDDAIRSAINDMSLSHYFQQIQQGAMEYISCVAEKMEAPSVLFKPSLSIDGNKWCALYGENLQDGVAGFGDSPSEAMKDFDGNWIKALSSS